MAGTMVPLHIKALKKKHGGPLTEEQIKLYQSREVASPLGKSEILQRLKEDPLTSRMKITESEEEIRLRTGLSPSSFGERIRIRFSGQQQLTLSSRPIFFMNVVDSGKNWQNVEYLEKLLTENG
jgi:hypothetical protein